MKIFKILILTCLMASTALAQSTRAQISNNLIGLGMSPELSTEVSKDVSGNAYIAQSLLPGTDNSYDLGSASKEWRNFFLAGDIIDPTAAKGLVLGETSRAANVTTVTTLAAPLYDSVVAANTDAGALVATGNTSAGLTLDFFKTRATSGQASTIVQSGDIVGKLDFYGANGTSYDPAARIKVSIDATPGASADMPGAIDFLVSPDGTATLASALKLGNDKTATLTGDANLATAGKTVKLTKGGGAATSGQFTCNGVTAVVVSTTAASANMVLAFAPSSISGTAPVGAPYVSAISAATSFSVKCSVAGETSVYNWAMLTLQ